jgi:hypothetical protein
MQKNIEKIFSRYNDMWFNISLLFINLNYIINISKNKYSFVNYNESNNKLPF